MDGIDRNTLLAAADYVAECALLADIHTVTLITNGAHGGVDVIIEGTDRNAEYPLCSDDDYRRTYEVH